MIQIGDYIREARLSAGLSLKELADKIGVTQASLSRWENNKRIPKITYVEKIDEILRSNITSNIIHGTSDNSTNVISINSYPDYMIYICESCNKMISYGRIVPIFKGTNCPYCKRSIKDVLEYSAEVLSKTSLGEIPIILRPKR